MAKTYTTAAGDMWDKIAKEQLGSEYLSNQLIDANFKYSKVVKFEAGVVLNIPEIVQNKSKVNLPPWKR
ncbi:MAG: phage tail protein [Burkholderiales bacterium]|nr:phage tail protein [Burkholderiales bacterium]